MCFLETLNKQKYNLLFSLRSWAGTTVPEVVSSNPRGTEDIALLSGSEQHASYKLLWWTRVKSKYYVRVSVRVGAPWIWV